MLEPMSERAEGASSSAALQQLCSLAAEALARRAEGAEGAEGAASQRLLLLWHRPGSRPTQAIFMTQPSRGPAQALKCFLLSSATGEERTRVRRELQLAVWASKQGVGAPVMAVKMTPQVAVLVMKLASNDLERLQAAAAPRLPPFFVLRDLWRAAFLLVRDKRLVARGLVCADLKAANLLLFAGSHPAGARIADFDPWFWRRVKPPDDAAVLNTFCLLANSAFWRPRHNLGALLPPEALEMAAAVEKREPALLELLQRHVRLLRKGPLHYWSRAMAAKRAEVTEGAALRAVAAEDLERFLAALEEALRHHELLAAPRPE